MLCGNVPTAFVNATTEEGNRYKCTLCKKQLEDIAMHFIISCTHTAFPREAMIGLIFDRLDVQDSGELFNLDDLEDE